MLVASPFRLTLKRGAALNTTTASIGGGAFYPLVNGALQAFTVRVKDAADDKSLPEHCLYMDSLSLTATATQEPYPLFAIQTLLSFCFATLSVTFEAF